MAIVIVVIELIVFEFIYLLISDYIIATIISFIAGFILNWLGGRRYIFEKSKHATDRELYLIVFASFIGLLFQVFLVSILVQTTFIYPVIAKALSISVSFGWNYWFRLRIIYPTDT